VSVRPRGQESLGTRVEIKNLNSFRHVARALEYEIARQTAVIESGGTVLQQTRLWSADRGETAPMRSKEEAHDYRYFPDPDLPHLVVSTAWIEEARRTLPELPARRQARFVSDYGLPPYDAGVLTQEPAVAEYFEAVARGTKNAKAASNWVMTEVLRKLKDDERPLASSPVSPGALATLIEMIERGEISGRIAKEVFERMWTTGQDPSSIVEASGLRQIIAEVVAAHPEQVASYRGGRTAALGWFVGQVMKRTSGQANPQVVNALLRRALDGEA
jgi:aspartyl-tRNA(Asn)/glutamyl-tRNA(Gln) amidotransferase subunit B